MDGNKNHNIIDLSAHRTDGDRVYPEYLVVYIRSLSISRLAQSHSRETYSRCTTEEHDSDGARGMKLLQSHIGNDDSRIVWHEEAKVTRIIYPELFLTAVGNIISNAQKFTKQGGIIDIILTKDALIIRDNGIGISKKDLLHIFDRLYKVDQARTSGT